MKKMALAATALAALSILTSACAVSPSPKNKTSVPSAAAGGKLYRRACAPCHQSNGSGGKMIGTASSADLRQSALKPLYHNSTSLLERAIWNGRDQGNSPLAPEMIRWKTILSKTQVDNIIAYLKTLK